MEIFQVDAFTNKLFSGNPAAVCILEKNLDDNILQNIASEMNLSEIAFIKQINNEFELRWFTPIVEVDLCGHATLAAAHILFEKEIVSVSHEIIFNTKSGKLPIIKEKNKIVMNFPQKYVNPVICPDHIRDALGIEPVFTFFDNKRYLIEVENETILKNMKPNFTELENEYFGFMITAKSNDIKYDFVSRFFAPCVGINEDPVTGSAHSYLAPYWSKKLNKKTLIGLQASKRSGVIDCEIINNNRVLLKGEAITVLKGSLQLKINGT